MGTKERPKRILVTGKTSYIGTQLKEWLERYPERYCVDLISLREPTWREKKFTCYDAIVHAAGIAHISPDPTMRDLYFRVNRDLTIEVARKAKTEKVKQFIFLSSIIVYGDSSTVVGLIDEATVPKPSSFYGESKLQAELGILPLQDDEFDIVILRLPMVYGKGSKGNYPKLAKAAKYLPFFPDVDNRRSMIHIDNLCEFIKTIIEHEDCGLFFPQNAEYVQTSEMVRLIAKVHGRNIRLTRVFNPILRLASEKIRLINKVFGCLAFDMALSEYGTNYRVHGLQESIEKTEIT